MNNVSALIAADKAVRADLDQNYRTPTGDAGPYWDGMYGTGMTQELLKLGFVVVPQKQWAAVAEAMQSAALRSGWAGGMTDEQYQNLLESQYSWTPEDEQRLREKVKRIGR